MTDEERQLVNEAIGALRAKHEHLLERLATTRLELEERLETLERQIKTLQGQMAWT